VVIRAAQEGNARLAAVLMLRDGVTDPAPAVRRANELLAEHQRMREWFVWPEQDFPRTSTQKPCTARFSKSCKAKLPGGDTAWRAIESAG